MKICTLCKVKKSINDFYYSKSWGYTSRCKKCTLKTTQERIFKKQGGRKKRYETVKDTLKRGTRVCCICSEEKKLQEFDRAKTNTTRGWVFRSKCKKCNKKLCSEYGKSNRKKRNKRLKKWRKCNPELAKMNDKRKRYKKYGITLKQLELLKKTNNYCCWICDRKKRLFVDHCHKTNKIRGILCPQCNTYLGIIEDSIQKIEKLKKYLENKSPHSRILIEIANN